MPYITVEHRKALASGLRPDNAGQLNYVFTTAALLYVNTKGESYQTFNDIIGALEACKLEFYRRMVADYENEKALQNGDVY